jgi:fatty-acid peroxygenase
VAVSVYATLAAHALFEHPEWRAPFKRGDRAGMLCFVQEVRRYYPFFPALAARVRRSFRWRGCEFTAGSRVLLDVNGTNHDPRAWRDPERFDPNRFREPCDDSFAFIPQGGGDAATGHRCPGEGIAIAVTAAIVEQLVLRLEYALPEQRLAIDRSRVPALPRDRFVMERVALTL